MRAVQYLLILFVLTVTAGGALVLTGLTGLMNYLGPVSGFVLLNFESQRPGNDPLVGWIFDSFASGAGFPDWTAADVTASPFVGRSLLAHLVARFPRLMLDRREYVRRGDTESAFLAPQNRSRDAIWIALLELAVSCVIWGDLYLFGEMTRSTATQCGESSLTQQSEQLVHSNPTYFIYRSTKHLRTWSNEPARGDHVVCAQLGYRELL